MAILFYDHLISKSELDELVSQIEAQENQRNKAIQLIDDILFQGIVSMILERLERGHHHVFLNHVHERPYDPEILQYLREKIGPDIEDDIRREADELVKKMIEDLRE